ncbi:MAG: S-layer homology domain-containing protein [Oscillibacter sp.]|nr:S-layer homology domain-containing protein [Oscillibacter sp.]
MKRFLTMFAVVLCLTAALTVTAAASDFDAVADDLAAIGMFRGTSAGYELDRAPKRSEAAIMLVRLYGAEESAKAAYEAGEISHPFTDVSPTASPAVAWLYTNGITKGTTATTFGSASACSARMYCAFLLRALGYEDGKDFQYSECLTFAQEKGFYDPILFTGTFLRDDLAALTYQGLAADLADGSTYLLDSLIKSGAIDSKDAKPMTKTIEAYRAMQAAMEDFEDDAMEMDINMTMDMKTSVEELGILIESTTSSAGTMAMRVDEENKAQPELAYIVETQTDGLDMTVGTWMKDGWIYQSAEYGDEKVMYKVPAGGELDSLEDVGAVEPSAMNVSGLAMIESITEEKQGSNMIYTLVIRENLGGAMTGAMEIAALDEELGVKYGAIKSIYTIRKGQLKKMEMVFSASVETPIPLDEAGNTIAMVMDYDYDMLMTIKKTGDDVVIDWPDFSQFQELPEGEEIVDPQEEVIQF